LGAQSLSYGSSLAAKKQWAHKISGDAARGAAKTKHRPKPALSLLGESTWMVLTTRNRGNIGKLMSKSV
jgi:hypothetical protein